MADETIYGCVDWETGQIEFIQIDRSTCVVCTCPSNCTYKGCIVWEGGHAGQVKIIVTLESSPCYGTAFYGCVNWATGRFEVVIDMLCCDCTPQNIIVTYTGLEDCPCMQVNGYSWQSKGNVAAAINGVPFVVPLVAPCGWGLYQEGDFGGWRMYGRLGCTGNIDWEGDYTHISISATRFGGDPAEATSDAFLHDVDSEFGIGMYVFNRIFRFGISDCITAVDIENEAYCNGMGPVAGGVMNIVEGTV